MRGGLIPEGGGHIFKRYGYTRGGLIHNGGLYSG